MSTITTLHRGRVPVDSLAQRLNMIRFEQGVSQRKAAEETGVPFGTWQGMELGRQTRNLDQHIKAISDRYGYDREWLMWGSGSTSGGPDGTPSTEPLTFGSEGWEFESLRARHLSAVA
ncbi:MAG: helix-turn-helix domain-containing protein [Propionibacteriaceae bacterium]|nr:helix-turn-helix domain-containing protein [Propionibacteriaceae bacterium]